MPATEVNAPVGIAMTDEQFLDEWQRRCFQFLWEQADPDTGLVADRAPADGSRKASVASIASVGFALTGICIADERGWVEPDAAYERVLTTLRFLEEKMPHVHGFYYHFVDIATGERVWECELSSVDTALLMAGVITVREYYPNTEAADIANRLYQRVDWPWMLNGGRTLSMGWQPESGFINHYWEHYSEHLVMQILGLGSPTNPLPPETWHAWRRGPLVEYGGMEFLSHPPLFVHQFSHAWVDFRGLRDDYADYWLNSVLATRAHRGMCVDLAEQFPHYGENMWGITSSDSEYGYTAWGGPEPSPHVNGTIVPCAAAGSIPFLPEESIAAVRYMFDTYGDQIWKEYGLVDAFNPHTGWAAGDVIGIDVGITLLMIENHRSGFVWEQFMKAPEVQNALLIAGFRQAGEPEPARLTSVYSREPNGNDQIAAWTNRQFAVPHLPAGATPTHWQTLDLGHLETGRGRDGHPLGARFAFGWNSEGLRLWVDVEDPQVATSDDPAKLYREDLVELFIDPENDGLLWGDPSDFQFGFAVPDQVWEWFGERQGVQASVKPTDGGYRVETTIPFEMLRVEPRAGARLSASVAVKSNDPATTDPLKLNWSWSPHVQRVYLGELTLEAPATVVNSAADGVPTPRQGDPEQPRG